jgi:Leucine-rich repeat (LRR) protein
MRIWIVLVLASCAHPVVRTLPAPEPPPAPVVKTSLWPVPVRVMTWTSDGIVQVGELPDHPPPAPLDVPWFVEPTKQLDEHGFAKLIVALRSEHVPGLSLRGQPVLPLAKLTEVPELTALVLDDTPTDDDDLAELHLALKRLYLQHTRVSDAGVAVLVTRDPQLEVLDLEGCAVGDPAITAIVALANLHALDLAGTRITDTGGAALGALHQLEILDLGKTKVAARTIAAIRPLALRELFIPQTLVGPEIATLGGYAPGIVRFDASSLASEYKPSDADVAWLANAPNLVEAALSEAKVDDKIAIPIAALPHLRELRLAATKITNAAVKKIATRTELHELDLADTPVDDASAAAMLAFPELHMLRLDGTPIGDAAFTVTPGAKLTELYISSTKISDTGAQILDRLPHLVALGLGTTKIGGATIERIAKLRDLRTLVLAKTRTDKLDLLGDLHALEQLFLEDTWLGDAELAKLSALDKLRVLHVEQTNVSDESLDVLRGFTRLEELTIGDTQVSAAVLAIDWPRLHTWSLLGLQLRDADLAALAHHASLIALDLTATEITDPTALAVLPNLRVLGLAETRLSKAGLDGVKRLEARGIEIKR